MARSAHVILAHVGEMTPAYMQVLNVLDLWRIEYVVKRPEAHVSADQLDTLSRHAHRAILLRVWAWPDEPQAFMGSVTAAFQRLVSSRQPHARPVVIDVLLDRRYAARTPDSAATLTIDVTAQTWMDWTARLATALHTSHGSKSELSAMEAIFATPRPDAAERIQTGEGQASDVIPEEFDADTLLGTVVGGYRLDRVVGEGEDAVTYHGVGVAHPLTQAEVSLYPLPLFGGAQEAAQLRQRFSEFTRTRRDFHHPGVVPVGEVGEHADYLYMTVPYPHGPTLADLLGANATMPLGTVASYLSQLAAAVDSADEHGIILSDLSPDNILITPYGQALITSVGYPLDTWPALERRKAIVALGAVLYAMATGRELRRESDERGGRARPLGHANPEPWRLRLDLPAQSEAAILGAMVPRMAFTTGAALSRAFRGGLNGLWTEGLTRELSSIWLKWWRSGLIDRGQALTAKRRPLVELRHILIGVLAIALLLLVVGPLTQLRHGGTSTVGTTSHGGAATVAASHPGGSVSSAQAGLAGVITTSDSLPPVPPLATIQAKPTNSIAFVSSSTPGSPSNPTSAASATAVATGTGSPAPGASATSVPVAGPTSTSTPVPVPTTPSTPGPTATPSVACVASGTTYRDTFASDQVGLPPSGYQLSGSTQATPVVRSVRGVGNELVFPYLFNNYTSSLAIKDEGGLTLCANYTVTVKMTFLTSGDKAGITLAWNGQNGDYIDIQPNVYWRDLEIHVSPNLGGQVVSGPALTTGGLPMTPGVSYWLQAKVTSSGPGTGAVDILWSTDGSTYSKIAGLTHLATVNGLAGMSTAGPNLPETAFGLFELQT